MANVRINMHHAEIDAFLRAPSGPVYQAVATRVRKTEAIAVATAPVNFGRLKGNRESGVRDEGSKLVGFVSFTTYYALYVSLGTGIYGPKGAPIKPKKGKALVFRGRDGELVYARQVKGMPPNPFLTNALRVGAAPWPVNVRPNPFA